MFNERELIAIQIGLEKEIASQKRAINTQKQPAFKQLAEQLLNETTTVLLKVNNEIEKLKTKTK